MSDLGDLLDIERELAAGSGSTYRERLRDDATVVIPDRALDKSATVEAMDDSPGWDAFSIEGERMVPLTADAALLTYLFDGRRGDSSYRAILSSVYVREEGEWRLAFHQQTPLS